MLLSQKQDALKGMPPDKGKEIPSYKLVVNFRVNTFHTTKITESTKVTRTYPDSSTKEYKRDVVYYTTTQIMESPTKGFQTIIVTLDSLNYRFSEGDVVFDFNTSDFQGNALKFKDLNLKTIALGRTYNLIYSPYGEIAKISSEDIEETMDYMKTKGADYLTPIELFIWNHGLSTNHLSYLGDRKKIVFPFDRIAKDSLWKSPLSLELNGYNYNDTLNLKIKEYNAGVFQIEGQSSSISHVDSEILTYEISDLVKILETNGSGIFNMTLNASGSILKSGFIYDIISKIKVGNQVIIENIESNVNWELMETFKL
jgi:hypothetical protein